MEGKLVRLRPFDKGDIDNVMRWVNYEEVTRFLGAHMTPPISRATEERFLEDAIGPAATQRVFAIETLGGRYIGGINLHLIEPINRKAEVGVVIAFKEYWGKGYGTDAMRAMLKFAFGTLNLNRVYLKVFDYNERAIKSYEKCGFKREGVLRQDRYYEGIYHDTIVMGILRDEFNLEKAS